MDISENGLSFEAKRMAWSAADQSSSFPGTWLPFWVRKKNPCRSLSKANYLRFGVVQLANGNCRPFAVAWYVGRLWQLSWLSPPSSWETSGSCSSLLSSHLSQPSPWRESVSSESLSAILLILRSHARHGSSSPYGTRIQRMLCKMKETQLSGALCWPRRHRFQHRVCLVCKSCWLHDP
jgi:hypothetical protein